MDTLLAVVVDDASVLRRQTNSDQTRMSDISLIPMLRVTAIYIVVQYI